VLDGSLVSQLTSCSLFLMWQHGFFFYLRRSDNISDALVCLHWLRVPERVEFKIAVLTYKVLYGVMPWYLGPLNRVADVSG